MRKCCFVVHDYVFVYSASQHKTAAQNLYFVGKLINSELGISFFTINRLYLFAFE
jgi:hypothetical protein